MRKNLEEHPDRVFSMFQLGLKYEELHRKYFPDREVPKGYQKLNLLAVEKTRAALAHPENYAWTNLFAPVEILQCFGLNCVSMECLSSFISGFRIEDAFIDYAENHGIAPTLCSYHKNFIGAVSSGIVPKPAYAVTTSMICDGNINTFRYLADKEKVDTYFLDIPHEYSEEGVAYVVGQLQEMIRELEKKFHKKFDMDRLREILRCENESRREYHEFLKKAKYKSYPTTMTLQLFMLYATHLNIGSEEVLDIFRLMNREIEGCPDFEGKKIFWVHLLPYYQETLQHYMNLSDEYQIQCTDFNLDYTGELDVEHPLEALAEKMLLNIYNGSFERKVEMISDIVKRFGSDAVIHFCHWGCKQSSGGVMLLKEEMKRQNIPMLVLDGDAMDRRNSHDGQIKTRLEAFLEMIRNLEGGAEA
jgi:benzoyl-CoA reductase/2-hydroxyglutaryl-CoA dehydratase subunit BcrC/BadD/HgdB